MQIKILRIKSYRSWAIADTAWPGSPHMRQNQAARVSC